MLSPFFFDTCGAELLFFQGNSFKKMAILRRRYLAHEFRLMNAKRWREADVFVETLARFIIRLSAFSLIFLIHYRRANLQLQRAIAEPRCLFKFGISTS
jgi:hypothetical protein